MRRVILGSLVGIASMAVQFGSAPNAAAQVADSTKDAQDKQIDNDADKACDKIKADGTRTEQQQNDDCNTVRSIATKAHNLKHDIYTLPNTVPSSGKLVVAEANHLMNLVVANPGMGIPASGETASVVVGGATTTFPQPSDGSTISGADVPSGSTPGTWNTAPGIQFTVTVACPNPPCTVNIEITSAASTGMPIVEGPLIWDPAAQPGGSVTLKLRTDKKPVTGPKFAKSNIIAIRVRVTDAAGRVTSAGVTFVHLG